MQNSVLNICEQTKCGRKTFVVQSLFHWLRKKCCSICDCLCSKSCTFLLHNLWNKGVEFGMFHGRELQLISLTICGEKLDQLGMFHRAQVQHVNCHMWKCNGPHFHKVPRMELRNYNRTSANTKISHLHQFLIVEIWKNPTFV